VADPADTDLMSSPDGDRPAPGDAGRDDASEQGRIARARDQVTTVVDQIFAARDDAPLIDAGIETFERDSGTGGSLLAGAIAFRLFLLLVPLLLLMYSGLGFLSHHIANGSAQSGRSLEMSQAAVDTMASIGSDASQGRWVTLAIGLGALVLALRSMIKSLRIVHLLAWRLPRRPVKNQFVALLAGLGVLVGIVAFALAQQWVRSNTPGAGLLASVVIGVGTGVVWFFVQQLLPRADGAPWTALIPGSVLVAVASQALHAFTVFYLVDHLTRMSETYGPLGVAMVMLLWLFILGRAIVGAAMLNATLWDRREHGKSNYAPLDPRIFRVAPQAAGADDTRTPP
jgi:uncharacterized BrkB/YihY/UPF0761 family membrane protein